MHRVYLNLEEGRDGSPDPSQPQLTRNNYWLTWKTVWNVSVGARAEGRGDEIGERRKTSCRGNDPYFT